MEGEGSYEPDGLRFARPFCSRAAYLIRAWRWGEDGAAR